jgi:hypothetical protein
MTGDRCEAGTGRPRPASVVEAIAGEPYASVTRVGRWLHRVEVHHGMMVLTPPWYRFGRRRAERTAARQLARYIRRERWSSVPTVVRAEDG